MVLSDGTISELVESGKLSIEPFEDRQLQPASVDLRLGRDFMVMLQGARLPIIEPVGSSLDAITAYDRHIVTDDEPYYYIYPHQVALCTTVETIKMPLDIIAKVEGKSTLARCGVIVLTAGYVAPGFEGEITLELINMTDRPVRLVPGMSICQLVFQQLDKPVLRPYGHTALGNRYQNQRGATPARYTPEELLDIIEDAEEFDADYKEALQEAEAAYLD